MTTADGAGLSDRPAWDSIELGSESVLGVPQIEGVLPVEPELRAVAAVLA